MQQLKNNIVVVKNDEDFKKYKKDIIKIWESSFGDSEDYINLFLDNNAIGNCVLLIEDNIAVSMLFLLDCELSFDSKNYKGKYVYAVATLKEYRKKGFTTKLLDYVNNDFIKNSAYDFTVLVPSEKELFSFYKKRGYETYFYCEKGSYSFLDTDLKNISHSDIDFVEYKKFRDKFLVDNYINWSENFIKYCYEENEFFGGKQIKIIDNNEIVAVCFLAQYNQKLILREIIFKNGFNDTEKVFDYLLKNYDYNELEYKSNLIKSSKKIPFGMVKWKESEIKSTKNSYIGLVLD